MNNQTWQEKRECVALKCCCSRFRKQIFPFCVFTPESSITCRSHTQWETLSCPPAKANNRTTLDVWLMSGAFPAKLTWIRNTWHSYRKMQVERALFFLLGAPEKYLRSVCHIHNNCLLPRIRKMIGSLSKVSVNSVDIMKYEENKCIPVNEGLYIRRTSNPNAMQTCCKWNASHSKTYRPTVHKQCNFRFLCFSSSIKLECNAQITSSRWYLFWAISYGPVIW